MKPIEELNKPLAIEDIEFRVQSVNKGGYATILAYKDARVDMNRLDDVCGALNWKREHFDNNTRCRVSIYNSGIKEWVSKEDVGTPSNTEAQKGLASDSFKRACFNWGIGRELYDYPAMSIKLNDKEFDKATKKATWDFKLKEWIWNSEFNTDGKLVKLSCVDNNGKERFSFSVTQPKPKMTVEDAIKEIEKAADVKMLLSIWSAGKVFQKDTKFVAAKDKRKNELTDGK